MDARVSQSARHNYSSWGHYARRGPWLFSIRLRVMHMTGRYAASCTHGLRGARFQPMQRSQLRPDDTARPRASPFWVNYIPTTSHQDLEQVHFHFRIRLETFFWKHSRDSFFCIIS